MVLKEEAADRMEEELACREFPLVKIHKIFHLCYSEIRYLERSVEGEQKIARFDVFVDYPVTVQVLQPIHQLAEIPFNKSTTIID